MTVERGLVIGVVAVVVATSLVSGPLVGAVDLTRADRTDPGSVGTGSATVGDITFPETAELATGRFGAETFYLRIPAATVELQRVIGQPILTYRVSIPDLGFTSESVHFVTERNEGTRQLSLDETTIDPSEVTEETYAGELTVNVRSDAGSRTVANGTVSIEVVR